MGNQQESSLIVWKVIDEFPRYEISNTGIIRNLKTKISKYTNKSHKSGYEYVQFKKNNRTHMKKVHRLVAFAHLRSPSEDLKILCSGKGIGVVLVNHKDGNKLNNNVDNLEWCDDSYNQEHAISNGLKPNNSVGQGNGMSILTDEIVHIICQAFEDGVMPSEATERFNISRSQASKIRSGHAWKHISSQYNIVVNKRKSSTTIP